MDVNRKQRRRHSAEFKAKVLAACAEPGASVAAVAMSFGVNDNLVHQWRRGRGIGEARAAATGALSEVKPEFVALSLPLPSPATSPLPTSSATPGAPARATQHIRMELKRGALAVRITWPISAASECAAWLREVLR